MTRISLKEAYDNRDVIAWLVKHQDEIDEMMNILKNINPDGDLTNIVLKTGDQTIDGTKTFIGKIVADCDIIQNGAAYETHAEQIFSQNDYLVMRDGQLSGLAAGAYSGLQVKKYNGSDDVRMVVDNTGIMRVGDINDERPLAVRDEAANLTSGALVKWDGVNQQMITSSANVGDDTHPVKIVGGEPVAVSGTLQDALTVETLVDDSNLKVYRYGKVVQVSLNQYATGGTGTRTLKTGLPASKNYVVSILADTSGSPAGVMEMAPGGTSVTANPTINGNVWSSLIYISE